MSFSLRNFILLLIEMYLSTGIHNMQEPILGKFIFIKYIYQRNFILIKRLINSSNRFGIWLPLI